MEQTILVADVKNYIIVWSLIFVAYYVVVLVQFTKLYKKHPELRRKQTEKNPQNQDLVRKIQNKTMYAFCLMFIWAAGIMFIAGGFKLSSYNWLPLLLMLAATVLPLMGIKRKEK